MDLLAGTIQSLTVAREVSPYGYFLTDGEQDVLLHYTEITAPICVGDQVDVFLFFDTEDRLAATMKRTYVTLGEVACLKVADIHPKYGCFLEMGIGRQLLLPKSELPDYEPLHPQVADDIYVIMTHDKFGRLVARPAREEDLLSLIFSAPEGWIHTWREAIVTRILKIGTFFVIDGAPVGFGVIGFLHESQRPRLLRLGERIRVRIVHIRKDGRVNVMLTERKEIALDQNAEQLFRCLQEHPDGKMPYSDQTSATTVQQRFNWSKSAFKRALGRLMKAGLIRQSESGMELTEAGKKQQLDKLSAVLQQTQSTPRKPRR